MSRAPVRTTPLLPICALLAGLASTSARADDAADQLDRVEAGIALEQSKVVAVEQRLAAASGTLDTTRAVDRFQEAVYQFLLGKHEVAAEHFFVLVTSGVLQAEGLQSEAEWYLGESLLALGYDAMAEEEYSAILDRKGDPFRTEAVRRLLEIYARDLDPTKFDRLYQTEIVRAGLKPNDLIVYSLGKALRAKGEAARAKAYLGGLDKKSAFWTRARYQIGAMLVEQGDTGALREAVGVFQEIGLVEPKTDEDRRVRDLALLALGRLQEHLGDPKKATEAYLRVPDDSPYRADQLHELTWLYIEQKATGAALETVEAFLEDFPDHPVAAELRLLRGHLQYEMGDADRALLTYDGVARAYAPVRDRFKALGAQVGDAHGYVAEVLKAVEASGAADAPAAEGDKAPAAEGDKAAVAPADAPAAAPELPGYAKAIMSQDPAFRRTVALWKEVSWTQDALKASEALLGELRGALAGNGPEELIEGARFSTLDGRVAALGQRLGLAAVEADWLVGRVPAQAAALGDLRRRRDALLAEVDRLAAHVDEVRATIDARLVAGTAGPVPGMDALVAEIDREVPRLGAAVEDVERGLRGVRNAAAVDPMDATAVRIDGLRNDVGRASGRLDRIARTLATVSTAELAAVHGVFAREAAAVASADTLLEREGHDVDDVAAGVVRANLDRLADLFGKRVLDAEMGAINVHWTKWTELGDERKKTAEERARVLTGIEREFRLLEQKLGK